MDTVSEIKARLPIEELVSQYCQLQKKGRIFRALCPFHNDTHPSLTVSPDKGIAYCFACQRGGDIFSFYQAIENVDFPQALKDLAEKAGVELRQEQFRAGPKKDEKDRMRECLESACAFYQKNLSGNEYAKKYLIERQVPQDLLQTFRIGYAPDSYEATYGYLLKKDFSRKEIVGAGLGIQKDLAEERVYDRFRNRIMFPISDHQGRLIGFGGRTIGGDDAKYINSPDGPLYNKSVALFGLTEGKEAIREKKTIILVEGYFDVLAFHRIGVRNVVSVSGTALTEEHAKTLKRLSESVLLSLDRDSAGDQASERAFLLCKKEDLDVRLLLFPTGKDPDECVRIAPEALKTAVDAGGFPYLENVLASLKNGEAKKRDILHRLLPLIASFPSAVEKEVALKQSAALLGVTLTALQDDLRTFEHTLQPLGVKQRLSPLNSPPSSVSESTVRPKQHPYSAIELFLGLLFVYPHHLPLITQLIEPEEEKERALYSSIKSLYTSGLEEVTPHALSEDCQEFASVLHLYCEEYLAAWSDTLAKKELTKLCQKANRALLLKKQQYLIQNIRQARTQGRKVEEEKLLTQYQQVLKLAQAAT